MPPRFGPTAAAPTTKGGFHLFRHGVGGVLSDWIYVLHAGPDRSAWAEATPAQRWMLEIFRREDRLDRAVDRLLAVTRELEERLTTEETNREILRGALMREVRNRDERIRDLEHQLVAVRGNWLWRWREGALKILGTLRKGTNDHEAAGAAI